jgi:membrane-associated phospholipid phosphatase
MAWQYVIVGLIVAAAAAWLGYSIYRTFTGKGGCEPCRRCWTIFGCPPEQEKKDAEKS